ncbi:hypothetical protein [Nocardiopsis halophila]|uniref:hypothetical protein n=1 Tax=Nocardiopsis halophila TaxID=141692 RepID=UPI00034C7A72|nr:hypothetical protein [Nocardiopsis halophila]
MRFPKLRMPWRLVCARTLAEMDLRARDAEEVAQEMERMRRSVRVHRERADRHRREALDALADRDAALRALLDAGVEVPRQRWARPVLDLIHALTPAGRHCLRDLMDQARPVRRVDGLREGDRVLVSGRVLTVDLVRTDGDQAMVTGHLAESGAPWSASMGAGEHLELADGAEGVAR